MADASVADAPSPRQATEEIGFGAGRMKRERGKKFRVPMKAASAAVDYVVKNGKRTAVILPIDGYEELLQDLDDLAIIARRKNELTIPLGGSEAPLEEEWRAAPLSFAGRRRKTWTGFIP